MFKRRIIKLKEEYCSVRNIIYVVHVTEEI